jgi:competence protein ComEC
VIPVLLALSVWLHLLIPAPLNLIGDALVVGVAFYFKRKGSLLLVVGLVLAQLSLIAHAHPETVAIASQFQSVDAVLEVTAANRVQVVSIEGCERCHGAVGSFFSDAQPGTTLRGNFLFRPARNYGQFVAKGRPEQIPPKVNAIGAIRSAFLGNLRAVSPGSAALVAGLAIGDTSLFNPGLEDNLKKLSLTHLSAVSGANCAIVVGLVYWLLGRTRLRRGYRVVAALGCLLFYVALVGGSPSVVRSAIMASVVLLAFARGVWPLAALSLAASGMLIYDPNYATDYGFALSVLATAGILVLTPELAARFSKRLPKGLALTLAATVAAQLWCMPVLLSLQGGIPTYAVLANLLVEPVVAPITVLGILACVLALPLPSIAMALSAIASIPAQWIVAVSERMVELPAVTLEWHTGVLGLLLVVASLSAAIYRKRFALLAVLVLLLELSFSGYALVRGATWLPANWEVVNCDVGQGDGLVIRSQGSVAVVDVGRDPKPIDDCLKSLRINRIDLLMLTHFDMDHVGGIDGALRGREVGLALLTPFKDDRPAATFVSQAVRAKAERVSFGSLGASGTLGDVRWQVLSPSPTAVEAEDSNDGSIVARWEAPGWELYTMADLGEKGQRRLPALHHGAKPLILKVSHHGSADQYPELIESLHPDIALISVGLANGYGHPTERTLRVLKSVGSKILRTDQMGALAVAVEGGSLSYSVSAGD